MLGRITDFLGIAIAALAAIGILILLSAPVDISEFKLASKPAPAASKTDPGSEVVIDTSQPQKKP